MDLYCYTKYDNNTGNLFPREEFQIDRVVGKGVAIFLTQGWEWGCSNGFDRQVDRL